MIFKVHTALSANLILHNISEPYFIWLIAKNIDTNGKGWVDKNLLQNNYLSIFPGTSKTFFNHFNKGLNIFYKINKNKCYLNSLEKIIRNFAPILKNNACFEINSELILLNDLKPKQILINCVIGSDLRQRPLSLWYISKTLNLNRSTITRNIHKSLIHVVTNSRADVKDMRKFWSSYIFVGGKRLKKQKEKLEIKSLIEKPQLKIKVKKVKNLNAWSIIQTK